MKKVERDGGNARIIQFYAGFVIILLQLYFHSSGFSIKNKALV